MNLFPIFPFLFMLNPMGNLPRFQQAQLSGRPWSTKKKFKANRRKELKRNR